MGTPTPRRWRQDRTRLIQLSTEIKASPQRQDWLLHMAQETQSFEDMMGLIHEFNELQGLENERILAEPNEFYTDLRIAK